MRVCVTETNAPLAHLIDAIVAKSDLFYFFTSSNAKTRFQSFFILTTVQPSFCA